MAGSAAAEGFFDAWTSKDFERARALLYDDVSFDGPVDSFSGTYHFLWSVSEPTPPYDEWRSALRQGQRARASGSQRPLAENAS